MPTTPSYPDSDSAPIDLQREFATSIQCWVWANQGKDGFRPKPMTTKAVERLIGLYVAFLNLDPNVTVHSLGVTALTTARDEPQCGTKHKA